MCYDCPVGYYCPGDGSYRLCSGTSVAFGGAAECISCMTECECGSTQFCTGCSISDYTYSYSYSAPSLQPSSAPLSYPTFAPTLLPSYSPSAVPSTNPSISPSFSPTYSSNSPSYSPSFLPTIEPSLVSPSFMPSSSLAASSSPSIYFATDAPMSATSSPSSPSFGGSQYDDGAGAARLLANAEELSSFRGAALVETLDVVTVDGSYKYAGQSKARAKMAVAVLQNLSMVDVPVEFSISAYCSSCPAGLYCPGDQAAHLCAAGYFSLTGAATCSVCPAGSYCPGDGLLHNCSIGYYNPTTGATSCQLVPAGKYS